MLRLSINLICLLLPLAAMAADAPEGRSIPYQKLYAPLAAVKKADMDGIVTSSLHAEPAQRGQLLPADLKIELHAGPTQLPLPVDKNGLFALPLRTDWVSGNAVVWINQPKEAVKIVETFKMRTPTQTHLSYAQLMESLPVIERIEQQHVDIGNLMTGAPQGVELAYDPGTPQSVTIGTGDQAKAWNSDGNGRVQVPFDAALPATTPVVLSALPTALRPYAN